MAGKRSNMSGAGVALALALGASALALPASAGSAQRKLPHKVTLRIAGGGAARELACGKTRRVHQVQMGQPVLALVRVANRRHGPGTAALRRARLRLERCDRGQWRHSATMALGRAP